MRAQAVYTGNGLIVHPTAFTEKQGALNLYAAAFDQYTGNGDRNTYVPDSLTYSPTDRADISGIVTYHDGHEAVHEVRPGLAGRYQFVPDTPSRPAFAVVASYLPNIPHQETAAAVLSHAFGPRRAPFLIAHTGLIWAESGTVSGHPAGTSEFVGVEVPITRAVHIVGETGTRFTFDPGSASAVGVLWRPKRGPDLTLGFANTGRGRTLGLFFGVGLSLGGFK